MTDAMTPIQRTVADQVIAEELAKRETLVISLCGAHAYGFASVDSDLDLNQAVSGVLKGNGNMLERIRFARLDQALERSTLPEQPKPGEALERWLVDSRIAKLGGARG